MIIHTIIHKVCDFLLDKIFNRNKTKYVVKDDITILDNGVNFNKTLYNKLKDTWNKK